MKLTNLANIYPLFGFGRHGLAVVALLAGALGLWTPSFAQNDLAAIQANIQAAPFKDVMSFPTRESFAEVVPLNEARLAAEAAGIVRQWHADVGAGVKSGDLLLSLDDRDARLALAQAHAATGAMQARSDLAQGQLVRTQSLLATGFVSKEVLTLRQTELVVAQADLASAQAQKDLAKRQLEKMQLLAPFDGVIIERHAQIGENLAAGALAFVLTDPVAVEVEARLSADQIASLQNAKVIETVMAGQTYPLDLLRVSPVAVLPSRTQSVRLGFKGRQRPVAGVTGQLRWQLDDPVLSTDLVVRRANVLGIFVLEADDERWVARFVSLENAQEGRQTPAPTLSPNRLVVYNGQQRLKDGQVLDQVDIGIRSN